MTMIEGEMDGALRDTTMSKYDRRKEWHKLRDAALSVCDDYEPATLKATKDDATACPIRRWRQLREKLNNHDAETRDDCDGGSHVVCSDEADGSNQKRNCCGGVYGNRRNLNGARARLSKEQSHTIHGWSADREREKD